MANKSSSKKTMDISKPGESAPETSSRPVVVTHRPMVQDPMVKESSSSDTSTGDAKTSIRSRSGKVIQPVSDGVQAENNDESGASQDKPTEEAENSAPASEQASEEPKVEKSAESSGTEAAVVDAVVDQATEDKKKQNQKNDEDIARQAAVQKLVGEKKYFVPVGQVSRRRNRRMLVVFLFLLALIAGGYLAVDSGMIETTIDLPFDFIKN